MDILIFNANKTIRTFKKSTEKDVLSGLKFHFSLPGAKRIFGPSGVRALSLAAGTNEGGYYCQTQPRGKTHPSYRMAEGVVI